MADQVTLGDATVYAVPSGQVVTLQDIIWDGPGPDGPVARFRFLAPAIARDTGTINQEAAGADLQHLCDTVALAALAARGDLPNAVMVSLADRPVVFGDTVPEATQFFGSYRIEDGQCVLELF